MEFVTVAVPQSESELSVMVSVLDANDIPHFVLNRGFGGLYPGMKVHLFNGQRVMVLTDRASDARDLLAVFLQPPTDFDADIKLAFGDRLRVIAELLLGGWCVPFKRRHLHADESDHGDS